MELHPTNAASGKVFKAIHNRKPMRGRAELIFMAIPCISFILLFNYSPLLGWVLAFVEYAPGFKLWECQFVGFKFFKLILDEPEFLQVLTNTMIISFAGLLATPLPAIFAILVSEMRSKKVQKVVQTTTTLPYFISWVLVYAIFFVFLSGEDGLVNIVLKNLGLISHPTDLLGNVNAVWILQPLISIWKNAGFSSIIYLAAIVCIDTSLYEAANIDGAGRFRSILHITIPGLIPTYVTLLLINIGNILTNGFDQFFVFYNPLVHQNIQVLDYYLYRIGIILGDYSYSTALGMSKTVISLILLFTANFISRKLRGQSIL